MKEWTKEEIERLVPELAQFILCAPLTTVEQALLQTRLDLENSHAGIVENHMAYVKECRETTRLRGALERSQSLIDQGIQYANGRDSEWGERAEKCFEFFGDANDLMKESLKDKP